MLLPLDNRFLLLVNQFSNKKILPKSKRERKTKKLIVVPFLLYSSLYNFSLYIMLRKKRKGTNDEMIKVENC